MKSISENCVIDSSRFGRAPQVVLSPSISDVAEAAQASVATVSRVINGHPHVRKIMKKRVLRAIQNLNYHPNAYSRSLRSGKTKTLGLLRSPEAIVDELYSGVITDNLIRYITIEDYSVASEFMTQSSDGILIVPEVVSAKRVDGIIIVGHLRKPALEQVATWNLPVCLINNRYDHPGFYSVSLDDDSGSREVMQYLAAIGRRRIAFIHGILEWPGTNGRYNGFIETVHELGLDVKPEHIIKVEDHQQNYQGGYLATELLLSRYPELDAIFYVNDWYAIGGICAAQRMGRRIPEDLSIIGYDDSWMAKQMLPTLTTVSLEPKEICRRAAMLLVRAAENRPQAETVCFIRPKLIVRDSSGLRRDNLSRGWAAGMAYHGRKGG